MTCWPKPYVCSFLMMSSYERKLKAFQRPAIRAPNDFPLSLQVFHFSSITTKQCCALKPFNCWHLVKCWLVCNYLYYFSSLSWRLVLSACFRQDGNFLVLIHSLKGGWRKSTNKSALSFKFFIGPSCSWVAIADFKFFISFNIPLLQQV